MFVVSWPGDSDDSPYEFSMEGIEGYIMAPDLEQAKWPGRLSSRGRLQNGPTCWSCGENTVEAVEGILK